MACNLYQIQDDDGEAYVEATSLGEAVELWREWLTLSGVVIAPNLDPEGVVCLGEGPFLTRERLAAIASDPQD